RAWDEARGVTVAMRVKGEAADYRYFPDPDLPPLVLEEAQVERWRAELPELPGARRRRFVEQYGLPAYDAGVLTASRALADFFEAAAAAYKGPGGPKAVSNWVMGEFLRLLNEDGLEPEQATLRPEALARLIELVDEGVISHRIAREEIFPEVFRTGRDPGQLVEEKGLRQISDEGELQRIVMGVIEANPGPVNDVRQGKEKAIAFLVG